MKKQLLFSLLIIGINSVNAQMLPYQNPQLSAEERAEDLLGRLTLEEKTKLMMDVSPAIPRLGIPEFHWWNEALHGIGRNGIATVFPITMAMAATFNDHLVYQAFTAASDEARAKNTEARKKDELKRYRGLSFWTPNINIFRDPRWGRGQETYGEDPYLTSRMGVAVVNGLQGQEFSSKSSSSSISRRYKKLFACAKHYAVHSGPEWNRHEFDVQQLPERDLWETYLPAFKALVKEGKVKEIMCAYQAIDGEPCCGNTRYLQRILRDEWGFQGIVTSDCGAIDDFYKPGRHHFVKTEEDASAHAVIAGTDVECGSVYKSLPEAVRTGKISEQQLDISLRRLLIGRFELGDFDPDELVEWTQIPMSVVASKEHKQLALQMAREGTVLLKNNGVLPLAATGSQQSKMGAQQSKIVVMGPNANDSTMMWGNYNGQPTQTTTILQGIRHYLPNVPFIQGCTWTRKEVPTSMFNQIFTDEGQPGLQANYWNNDRMAGLPAMAIRLTEPLHLDNGGNTAFAPGVNLEHFTARYEGVFRPQQDGEVTIDILNDDYAMLVFNGDTLLNRMNGHGVRDSHLTYKVKAGNSYPLVLVYVQYTGHAMLQFDINMTDHSPVALSPLTAPESPLKDADIVIFVGGISPRLEGEEMKVNEEGFKGGDRTSIELPQVQREWLANLKKAGKRIIYVNCSGSAIALTPEDAIADAVVQAWYGGEQGGKALAEVLFGDYNPSGKLPITFYRSTNDLPDFLDYRMTNRTYRYFKGEPLYPFGYGLSYTAFEIGKPQYINNKVRVKVTNTGKMDGTEVIQVYIRNLADQDGPLKTLRAYQRVSLKAGENKTIDIDFPRDRFEGWDVNTNTMRVVPGKYSLMVGSSSADKDLKAIDVDIQ
ncbi:MAG: glycoside hydrolase family 3 C-terminal domain-containing protein [Prevotella sp.]|nr:glycoside hydrolase family 3 C-terminal domain-containing protein [Prevotella sp.]